MKDHKVDLNNNQKTRLIHLCHSDIGQISEIIIDKINNSIRKTKKTDRKVQRKKSKGKNLEMHKYKLIKFDIEDFNRLISESLEIGTLILPTKPRK